MASEDDPQRRSRQKKRLADAIRGIEASYRDPDSVPSVSGEAPVVDRAPRRNGAEPAPRQRRSKPDLRTEPRLHADPRPARKHSEDEFPAIGRSDRAAEPAARRAPFALMLSVVVLLAMVVVGGWWVFSTGAFQSAAERDTSVPNPPAQLQSENYLAGPPEDQSRSSGPARIQAAGEADTGWVTLFNPSDPTTLSLEGNANAAIDSDPFGAFARIVSPDTSSTVSVDVPQGTLEALAGKTAQFSIVARADDGAETQMSVTCDLAEYGDCGRLRFAVIASDNEFLFRVDLPEGVRPSGPGRLIFLTDLDNTGKAVKLSAVRVRELQP